MGIKLANFARATLATPPSGTTGLSFTVAAGKGALFPTLGAGDHFYGVFTNAGKTAYEIVKIEARSTDSFTIAAASRGLDGTTAATWTTSDIFYYALTKKTLEEVPFSAATTAVSALTPAADKLPYFTGVAAAANADFTAFGRSLVDDANAAAGRTTLGVAIGTDVQAYDATTVKEAAVQTLTNKTLTNCTANTQAAGDSSTKVATTAYVDAMWTTGDAKLTLKTAADTGWVLMNDGSIGSAASGATTRANADTSALFTLLWNNTADSACPVSGGRGASAAADYAANKTITLPKALGRALAVYGSGSGLTARTLAQTTGTETHTLTTGEMPAHTHTSNVNPILNGGGSGFDFTTGGGSIHTTNSTGGGGAHNNMQPTVFLNVMIKL